MSIRPTRPTTFEPGDVLLAFYPFTDRSAAKLRPVLVISKSVFNNHGDFVAVPISSRTLSPISREHGLLITESDGYFKASGLRQSSSVKWTKPMTLSRAVIERKIGSLPTEVVAQVASLVASMLCGQSDSD